MSNGSDSGSGRGWDRPNGEGRYGRGYADAPFRLQEIERRARELGDTVDKLSTTQVRHSEQIANVKESLDRNTSIVSRNTAALVAFAFTMAGSGVAFALTQVAH